MPSLEIPSAGKIRSLIDCDPWWEPESQWHIDWKGAVPTLPGGGFIFHQARFLQPTATQALLELPMIPREKRRVETDFWREFEQVRPGILGALLDAVACGLKNLPTTRPESCPRMADFATWIVACEPALGWAAGTFLKAYERNRDEANSLSVEASVIGTLIQEIAAQGEWIGTATELLKKLSDLGGEDTQKQWGWPKNGRAVSGQLKRIAPNLRAEGVIVNWLPRMSGRRQIQILRAETVG